MEPTSPRPTREWILEQYSSRVSFYSNLHAEIAIDEKYRRNDYRERVGGMPPNFPVKLPPTGPAAVGTLTDHVLLGQTPDITVMLPAGSHRVTAQEQVHVEKIRGWLKSFWYKIESNSVETPLRDFVAKAGGYGLGALRYCLDWDAWPDPPERKPAEKAAAFRKRQREYDAKRLDSMPISVMSVHPLNFYPDPAHDPPQDFIEVQPRAYKQIEDVWPAIRDTPPPMHPERAGYEQTDIEVELLIYASRDWYALYANGQPMLTADDGADDEGVAPNTSGLFYRMATAGFGSVDRENRPEHRYVGILRYGRDTLDMETAAVNQIEAIRAIAGFGSWDVTGDDEESAKQAARGLRFGPSEIWAHGREVQGKPLTGPVVPDVVTQSLEITANFVALAFGSQTLRGIAGGAGVPASLYRTQLGEARLMFGALVQSCQQAVQGLLLDVLALIRDNPDDFKNGVSVWGGDQAGYSTLKPNEIPAGLLVKVAFMPPTPEEKSGKLQEGLQLRQQGAISTKRFLEEYAGVDDPQAELKAMVKDEITRKLASAAADIAVKIALQRLEQQMPGITALAAPGGQQPGAQPAQVGPNGPVGPSQQPNVQSVGPGGFTQPGEQPPPPNLGSPADIAQQQGGPPFPAPGLAGGQ